MKELDANMLNCFSLFRTLSHAQQQEVARYIRLCEFKADETVCVEDADSSSMFFIYSGKLLISQKTVPLATLEPFDHFGEMSLLENTRRSATVTTLAPTILLELPSEVFHSHLKNHPQAIFDFLLTFDKRLRKHNALVVDQFLALKKQLAELQEAHRQLLQTDKLATIGMITAGIAHEINNPLAIINGYLEVLQEETSNDDHRDKLTKLRRAASAIERIVMGLKTYVRIDSEESTAIALNQTIQASLDLVSYLYKKDQITIETSFVQPDPVVWGSRGQLQQVVLNLMSNSKHALEGRLAKRIFISTESINSDLYIKVADNGCGIKPTHIARIFERFFTTKEAGRGTGLGLEIIKSIIEQMGGAIAVESTIDVGTTFTIRLPKYNPK